MRVTRRVNNVGTKPVKIKAVSGGTDTAHIGAAIDVKGSGKTLRGLCDVLADSVPTHIFELR